MLALSQLQYCQPQQWSTGQVKRLSRFLRRQSLNLLFLFCFTEVREVEQRYFELCSFTDLLPGMASVRDEPGPQRLVPPHDLFHCLLEQIRNERAMQAH